MTTKIRFTIMLACLGAGVIGCQLNDEQALDELDVEGLDDEALDVEATSPAAEPTNGPEPNVGPPQIPKTCFGAPLIGKLGDPFAGCELDGNLPQGWVARQTFDTKSPLFEGVEVEVPAALRRFCTYTPDPGMLEELGYEPMFEAIEAAESMELATVGADCVAFGGAGELPDEEALHGLQQAFRAGFDLASAEELGETEAHRVPIRLTFIDTVSDLAAHSPGIEPRSYHGLQLGELAGEILCPSQEPECLDMIRYVVALPRDSSDDPTPNYVEGGRFGTASDVARATYYAVVRQLQDHAQDPDEPAFQVLNFSIGRQVEDGGDNLARGRGPRDALERVLDYASCAGNITVAAAGNNPYAECPLLLSGWTFPASLESNPMPKPGQCDALGFDGGGLLEGSYRHPVYAVSAVDGADQPLATVLEHSEPRLVAYGSYAKPDAGPVGRPLAGTSISSAGTAALAALVRSYRPDLQAAEIMDIIYEAGHDVGREADVYAVGAPSLEVHRVSTRAALGLACAGQPDHACPQLDGPAPEPDDSGHLMPYYEALAELIAGVDVEKFIHEEPKEEVQCEPSDEPWVMFVPMPEDPVCKHCSIDVPTSSLVVLIDPQYEDNILDAELSVYVGPNLSNPRGLTLTWNLGSYVPAFSSTVAVNISLGLGPPINSAVMTFDVLDPITGGICTQSSVVQINTGPMSLF